MKTKNGHILTFSYKMQISALLNFATCDWFCPMSSHLTMMLHFVFWLQWLETFYCGTLKPVQRMLK